MPLSPAVGEHLVFLLSFVVAVVHLFPYLLIWNRCVHVVHSGANMETALCKAKTKRSPLVTHPFPACLSQCSVNLSFRASLRLGNFCSMNFRFRTSFRLGSFPKAKAISMSALLWCPPTPSYFPRLLNSFYLRKFSGVV